MGLLKTRMRNTPPLRRVRPIKPTVPGNVEAAVNRRNRRLAASKPITPDEQRVGNPIIENPVVEKPEECGTGGFRMQLFIGHLVVCFLLFAVMVFGFGIEIPVALIVLLVMVIMSLVRCQKHWV